MLIILLHFALTLLHFVLVLHFARLLLGFALVFCGDYYILRRNRVSNISPAELVPGVSGMSPMKVECGVPIWVLLFLFFLGTAAPGSSSLII